MELEYAFFARYVEPAIDGTLTILGADVGKVFGEQYPVAVPPLGVVIKFRKPMPDLIRFKFQMNGPEGVGMVLTSGDEWQEAVARKEETGASAGSRLVINLPAFALPVVGDYLFSFTIDGGPTVELPLKAVSVKGVTP